MGNSASTPEIEIKRLPNGLDMITKEGDDLHPDADDPLHGDIGTHWLYDGQQLVSIMRFTHHGNQTTEEQFAIRDNYIVGYTRWYPTDEYAIPMERHMSLMGGRLCTFNKDKSVNISWCSPYLKNGKTYKGYHLPIPVISSTEGIIN